MFFGKDCLSVNPALNKDGNWELPLNIFNGILDEGDYNDCVPVVAEYTTPDEVKCVRTARIVGDRSHFWYCPFDNCNSRTRNSVKDRTNHICLHLVNNECLPNEKDLVNSGRMCGFCGSRGSDCRVGMRKNGQPTSIICKAWLGSKNH